MVKQFNTLALASLSAIAFSTPSFAGPGQSAVASVEGCLYNNQVAENGVVKLIPTQELLQVPSLSLNINNVIGKAFEENTRYSFGYGQRVDLTEFFLDNPNLGQCFDLSKSYVNYVRRHVITNEQNLTLYSQATLPGRWRMDLVQGWGGVIDSVNYFYMTTAELPDGVLNDTARADIEVQIEVVSLELVPLLPIDGDTHVDMR